MEKALIGLFLGAGWIAGVCAAVFDLPLVTIGLGALVVGIIFFMKHPHRGVFLAFEIAFSLAFLHTAFQIAWNETSHVLPQDRPLVVRGYISSEPVRSGDSERFRIMADPPYEGSVRVFGRTPVPLIYGENVEIKGIVRAPEERGGEPTIFSAEIQKREGERGYRILKGLYATRRANAAALRRLFPGDSGALMSGLLLGTTEGISNGAIEAMRRSGSTHVVALSGYNVAIIIFALSALFRKFLSRRGVWLSVSGIIFLFMLMSGSEPSLVRASFMGFLLLWAKELGRAYSLPHATVFAAVLMLLWDPLLVRNAGFQLSFASLVGISYGADQFIGVLKRCRVPEWLREPFSLTIAAQIAVIPILSAHFGEVSPWALPANLLILPIIPITMALGFLTLITQWVLFPLALAFAPVVRLLLEYELGVIRWFGEGNGTLHFSISPLLFAVYYLILAFWWLHGPMKRDIRI
jgi:competence protein ComEC